jgi:curved DNA-binding protein
MQNFRNYYELLGIEAGASAEEIKRAYRQLARRYHPDLNPGDKAAEDQFKRLSEAYAVLSDTDKRSRYNQFSQFWEQGIDPGAEASWGGSSNDYSRFPDFDEFLDDLLGRRQGGNPSAKVKAKAPSQPGSRKASYTVPPRTRAQDIEAHLKLPLEMAYRGGRERIRLDDGRAIEVDLPPGLVDQQQIRLRGLGIGEGDLYLLIQVQEHPFFRVEECDVYCQLPVTPSEAALGSAIEVPTLDGLVKMTLPRGVRTGQRLRLAGKGYPQEMGKAGDQIVEIQVVVPQQLSNEEEALYQQLRQVERFNPRARLPV